MTRHIFGRRLASIVGAALLALLYAAWALGVGATEAAAGEADTYDASDDAALVSFGITDSGNVLRAPVQVDVIGHATPAPLRPTREQVAPNSTRIFRAVEPDELADLRNVGQYRAGGPHAEWLDGKRFWMSQADADAYVALATKADLGGPYCVTSGCIPNSVLDQIQVVTMDGMDAVFLPNDLLPFIDDLNLPSPP